MFFFRVLPVFAFYSILTWRSHLSLFSILSLRFTHSNGYYTQKSVQTSDRQIGSHEKCIIIALHFVVTLCFVRWLQEIRNQRQFSSNNFVLFFVTRAKHFRRKLLNRSVKKRKPNTCWFACADSNNMIHQTKQIQMIHTSEECFLFKAFFRVLILLV